jgi:hypothetical protein
MNISTLLRVRNQLLRRQKDAVGKVELQPLKHRKVHLSGSRWLKLSLGSQQLDIVRVFSSRLTRDSWRQLEIKSAIDSSDSLWVGMNESLDCKTQPSFSSSTHHHPQLSHPCYCLILLNLLVNHPTWLFATLWVTQIHFTINRKPLESTRIPFKLFSLHFCLQNSLDFPTTLFTSKISSKTFKTCTFISIHRLPAPHSSLFPTSSQSSFIIKSFMFNRQNSFCSNYTARVEPSRAWENRFYRSWPIQ